MQARRPLWSVSLSPCPPCWALKSPSAWEAFQPWEVPPPDYVSDSRTNLHLKTLYSTANLNPDFFRKGDRRWWDCSLPTPQAPVCCLHFDSTSTRCPPPPGSKYSLGKLKTM